MELVYREYSWVKASQSLDVHIQTILTKLAKHTKYEYCKGQYLA